MRTSHGIPLRARTRRLLALCGAAASTLAVGLPAASADTLPAACGTLVGNARTCDLYAAQGTIDLPGNAGLKTWLFTDQDPAGATPTGIGGPVLVVNEGETVTLRLHNTLGVNVSLDVPQQGLETDDQGISAGATKDYTFVAKPGTALYEAGPTATGKRQVAMGLYGALVVLPSADPQSAYGDAGSHFDNQHVMVVSEVDPALNGSADPSTFDLQAFAPRFWLVNGQTTRMGVTGDVPAAPGERWLMRYVNAGLQDHNMAVLNVRQTLLAQDGQAWRSAPDGVVAPLPQGTTSDTLVTVPADAAPGQRFAVYDQSTELDVDGEGAVNFLSIAGAGVACSVPHVTGLNGAPEVAQVPQPPVDGHALMTVTGTASACNGASLASGEWFLDSVESPTAHGTFDPSSGSISFPLSDADADAAYHAAGPLGGDGPHAVYVRVTDSNGKTSPVGSAIVVLDNTGPKVSALSVTPSASKGDVDLTVKGTADDRGRGDQNVDAYEYALDGGAPVNVPVDAASQQAVVALESTLTAPFAEGHHSISVRAHDAIGNWGDPVTVPFTIDTTAPVVTPGSVAITPSPNNGTLSWDKAAFQIRVDAAASDPVSGGVSSAVTRFEGAFDACPAPGAGSRFEPKDGVFDTSAERGYVYLPLSVMNKWLDFRGHTKDGDHPFYVRAQDAAGNWSTACAIGNLRIDTRIPLVDPLVANLGELAGAAPRRGAGAANRFPTQVTLRTRGTDSGFAADVDRAEWYVDQDPGKGKGQPLAAADGRYGSATEAVRGTISARRWTAGAHTIFVRVRDLAGNWSKPVSAQVTLRFQPLFANGFERGGLKAWSSATGSSRLRVLRQARLDGRLGLRVASSATAAYVTDGRPHAEASYRASFAFDPNGSTTGGASQAILAGLNARGRTVVRVERRTVGKTQLVRVTAASGSATAASSWLSLSDAPHRIQVAWFAAGDGEVQLLVDGGLAADLTGLKNAGLRLDAVRLGLSAGLSKGAKGSFYLDSFGSTK